MMIDDFAILDYVQNLLHSRLNSPHCFKSQLFRGFGRIQSGIAPVPILLGTL